MFLYLKNSETTTEQIRNELNIATADMKEQDIDIGIEKIPREFLIYEDQDFAGRRLPYFESIALQCSLKLIPGFGHLEDQLFIKFLINPILIALKLDEEENLEDTYHQEALMTLKSKAKDFKIRRFNGGSKAIRNFTLRLTFQNLYIRHQGYLHKPTICGNDEINFYRQAGPQREISSPTPGIRNPMYSPQMDFNINNEEIENIDRDSDTSQPSVVNRGSRAGDGTPPGRPPGRIKPSLPGREHPRLAFWDKSNIRDCPRLKDPKQMHRYEFPDLYSSSSQSTSPKAASKHKKGYQGRRMRSSSPQGERDHNESWDIDRIRRPDETFIQERNQQDDHPGSRKNKEMIRNQVRAYFDTARNNKQQTEDIDSSEEEERETGTKKKPGKENRASNNLAGKSNAKDGAQASSLVQNQLKEKLQEKDKQVVEMRKQMTDMKNTNDKELKTVMEKMTEMQKEMEKQKLEMERRQVEMDRAAAIHYTQYRTANMNESLMSMNNTTGIPNTFNAPPILPFIQTRPPTTYTSTARNELGRNLDLSNINHQPNPSETLGNSIINNLNRMNMNVSTPTIVNEQNTLDTATAEGAEDHLNSQELQKILNRSRENRANPFQSTDESSDGGEIYFETANPKVEFPPDIQKYIMQLPEGTQDTANAVLQIEQWFKEVKYEDINTEKGRKQIDALAVLLVHLSGVINASHQPVEIRVQATRIGKLINKKWKSLEKSAKRRYTGTKEKEHRERVEIIKKAGIYEDTPKKSENSNTEKSDMENISENITRSDTVPMNTGKTPGENPKETSKNPFEVVEEE